MLFDCLLMFVFSDMVSSGPSFPIIKNTVNVFQYFVKVGLYVKVHWHKTIGGMQVGPL